MIGIMSQSGHTTYNLKEFVIDTPADLENLPVDSSVPMGSLALVISTSQVYVLNSERDWIELE